MGLRKVYGSGLLLLLIQSTACAPWPTDEPAWELRWSGQAGSRRAEIVVDFTDVRGRQVPVTIRVSGMGRENLRFYHNSKNNEYTLHDVRFEDAEGRPIGFRQDGRLRRLDPFEGDLVQASWLAQPGNSGRHGLQGAIAEDWATFEGRIFLIPKSRMPLDSARVQFLVPDGWRVATPFRRKGPWHYVDTFGPEHTAPMLESSCFGVGRFDITERRFGDMPARVAVYSDWSEEHKSQVVDSTYRVISYFHRTLDFDIGAPYSVVWTPEHNGRTVHGGSNASGTCLQQPEFKLRPYQLLAHRMAHSMDKYKPTGMKTARNEHLWFREGWPSYMEVLATAATGIAPDQGYFNTLYSNYKIGRRTNIERDVPLTEEKSARGHVVEFLHYTKAPLATRMLADKIEARSGKTIVEFMRGVWAEHGFYSKPFDVKQELEKFAGASFDDFWETTVYPRGTIIPVWEEYLDDAHRRRMKIEPAAHVSGEPLTGAYLHYLAWTGDFSSFDEIREFVIAEHRRRRELDGAGLELYPEKLRKHLYALLPEDRYAIARYEQAQRLEPPRPSSVGEPIVLEIDLPTADGREFAALLEAERAHPAGPSRLRPEFAVRTRRGGVQGPPRLAFGLDSVLEVTPAWQDGSRRARIELRVDGAPAGSWSLARQGAGSTAVRLQASDRPRRRGVYEIRVSLDGGPSVTRAYWQRGTEQAMGNLGRTGLLSDRLLQGKTHDPQAWFKNGMALSAKGHHVSALSSFHQAALMDPENSQRWFYYAKTLAQLERHDDAVEAFDRTLDLTPHHVSAAGSKALSLALSGRDEEAAAALDYLMQCSHADTRWTWRGQVLDELGQLEAAADAYRQFSDRQPRRVSGWRGLGHSMLRLERYREAVDAFDRALAVDPRDTQSKRERAAAVRKLERDPS